MRIYQAYYTIVKFIPDLMKNEPINIGLIIHSPEINYIRTDFAENKTNFISRYNQDIDSKVVKHIINDIRQNFDNENFILRNHKMGSFDDDKLLYNISVSYANQLQFTKPKAIITQNLDVEFKRLFEDLIFKENVIKRHRPVEERTMKSNLKKRFDELGLIRSNVIQEDHVEIDSFGDLINIDFKYVNGKPNLIKNISLDIKSKDPMDHSKLWLTNYREIKRVSKAKGLDKDIQVIYYLPEDNELNMNCSIMACLKEASDVLIDYRDDERVNYFIDKVAKIAHN